MTVEQIPYDQLVELISELIDRPIKSLRELRPPEVEELCRLLYEDRPVK